MAKEIIIDGVDVSECVILQKHSVLDEYYCHHIDEKTGLYRCCNNRPNCYYKQLKRKEQELKELKEKYKYYDHYKESALYNKDLCNQKSDEIERLQSENEKLKEALDIIPEVAEMDCGFCVNGECERMKHILSIIKQAKGEEC